MFPLQGSIGQTSTNVPFGTNLHENKLATSTIPARFRNVVHILSKMKKSILVKLLPLIFLVITTIYLLVTIAMTNTVLMNSHVIGLVLLGMVIVTQIFSMKYGYWSTAFLLLLGTFSIASFTPTIFYFRIGVIKIDLVVLFISIIFSIVHSKEIPDWLNELRGS